MRTEPITIIRITPVLDAGGGSEGTATEIMETLAQVDTLQGDRRLEAQQTALRQGYRIRMWAREDCQPKTGDSIQYRQEDLTIQSWQWVDKTRRQLEIIAMSNRIDGPRLY